MFDKIRTWYENLPVVRIWVHHYQNLVEYHIEWRLHPLSPKWVKDDRVYYSESEARKHARSWVAALVPIKKLPKTKPTSTILETFTLPKE
jgi:hypothetical protein